jgi:hypothetical protein
VAGAGYILCAVLHCHVAILLPPPVLKYNCAAATVQLQLFKYNCAAATVQLQLYRCSHMRKRST